MTRAGASRWLAAAICAGFVARAAAGLALNLVDTPHGPNVRGFDFYGHMADNLLEGRGLAWFFYEGLGWKHANRGPLYPLLVAGVRALAGAAAPVATILVQSAIGAAGCLVPALLARRWAGWRGAVAAGWLAALWPYAVVIDSGLVEHVVYAPLVLLSVLAALRARDSGTAVAAVAAGVLAGIAALARLTYVVGFPFLAAALFVRPRGARLALLFLLGAGLALAPWALRNAVVLGTPTLGSDGGRALWLSNAEGTFDHYPARSIDDTERALFARMDPALHAELKALGADELAQDRRFREMALRNIEARPGAVAWGALRKLGAFFSPVYNPGPVSRVKLAVFGLTYVGLLVGTGLAVAACARLRADLPVLLAVTAGFALVSAVFWGQPRYLAPLHGLGLAAAGAWLALRREGRAAD